MSFKKGDKVRVVKAPPTRVGIINVGDIGVVLDDDEYLDDYISVGFEKSHELLHDCNGLCEMGHGWNFYGAYLEIIKEDCTTQKQFTKSDLQNGDVCICRNGDVGIYIYIENKPIFLYQDGFNEVTDYNERLESSIYGDDARDEVDKTFDIVKIYRPNLGKQCSFSQKKYTDGELVFDRDRAVPMKLSEVCKQLGKNIYIVEE